MIEPSFGIPVAPHLAVHENKRRYGARRPYRFGERMSIALVEEHCRQVWRLSVLEMVERGAAEKGQIARCR
jgi:hypothetical protein